MTRHKIDTCGQVALRREGRGAATLTRLSGLACLLACAWVPAAGAQTAPAPTQSLSSSLGVLVYPAGGQAADKQAADEGECFAWAKQQTGIDPFAAPPPPAAAPAPAPQQASSTSGGQRVRGAARGAAAGAVIGEIANDDASEGAAVGAAVGVMKGGAEKRQSRREAEEQAKAQAEQQASQQAAQQGAAQSEQRATFNKGFGACLEGRGYTVK